MKIQKRIDVRLVRKGPVSSIRAVQFDTANQLIFNVLDYELPSGTTATLYVRKKSGKFVYQTKNITVSGNTITVDLENQALTEHGEAFYQLRIVNGEDIISTFHSSMLIDPSLADKDAMESKTVIHAFDEFTEAKIAEVQAATEEFIAQAQSKVADKGIEVLGTIPADYTATSRTADSAIRTKADAIICSAVDNAVTVHDSSDDHLRGLKLFGKTTQKTTTGKNLLRNELYTMETNGLTITVHDDKTFTVNGTATAGTFLTLHTDFNPGAGDYILSGCPASGGVNKFILYITDTESGFYTQDAGKGYQFTHPGNIAPDVRLAVYEGVTVNNAHFKPMIRLASVEDDTFEPYTGGKASPSLAYPQEFDNMGKGGGVNVDVYGKNLWNHENDNADMSSVTGWGTAMWSNPAVARTLMPNTTYTLKFKVTCLKLPEFATVFSDQCGFVLYSSEDSGAYINMAMDAGHGVFAVGEQRTVVGTFKTPANVGDKAMHYGILRYTQRYYQEDKTPVYATVRFDEVQLEIGNTASGYEPFAGQTMAIPTDGGIPGVPVSGGGDFTDADGQQWISDAKDFERGVYIQRIQKTALTGTEDFMTEYQGVKFPDFVGLDVPHAYGGVFCTHAAAQSLYGVVLAISLAPFGVTTVSGLKAILAEQYANGTPVEIMYALPEPVETALTAAEIEAFKAIHSHYPNTTVLNDAGAYMEVKYNADTKTFIDNVIREAAVKTTGITLYANKWVDEGNRYSQVVAVNGVTANSKIDLQPTPEQLAMFIDDEMSMLTGNENGTVTVYAIGNKPLEDMTIQALITEVYAV